MPDAIIIIPAFNRQQLGERALRSVIAQNVPDIDIVAVEDCSQPPFHVLTDISTKPIRVVRHETNRDGAEHRH